MIDDPLDASWRAIRAAPGIRKGAPAVDAPMTTSNTSPAAARAAVAVPAGA